MNKEVYIFGHKNPDTDSICSAVSLAYLKNQMVRKKENEETILLANIDRDCIYIPMSAGRANSETTYILDKFGIEHPEVKNDIRRQIKDIHIKTVEPLDEDMCMKEAWENMNSNKTYTVPVVDDGAKLKGIITIGDIARKYMDVYDKTTISQGVITYGGLTALLEGSLLSGEPHKKVCGREVSVVTGEKELAKVNVQKDKIVIVSEGDKEQKKLIDIGVGCIIICGTVKISDEIVDMAIEKNIPIIVTEQDVYQVVRLINQGIPIKNIMKSIDEVCSFKSEDFIADIKEDIGYLRFRDFPVIDYNGDCMGMIGKYSLINMDSKKVILVDHNEINQGVFGLFESEIVEIIDHHKLATIETLNPISVINEPVGCTATIVADLYKKNGVEIPDDIGGILCGAIISDTMLFESPTCSQKDIEVAKAIAKAKNIDLEKLWRGMLKASSALDDKTEKEIFYQDYKLFNVEGFSFGIGQVLLSSRAEVESLMERMNPYMEVALEEEETELVGLMITDAISKETELIFRGKNGRKVIGSAFGVELSENHIHLKNIVSRKKQLIPAIMTVITE